MAIVVSHIAGDFDVLARQALRQAALGDLIELRLDRIGHPGEDALRELIRQSPKPVIVTVQGPEAFGSFRGSVDERCEILMAASRAGAMFVDIDASLSLELGEVEGKCHRIVSRHDLEGTPLDLEAFDAEVREVLYEGDAVKLVTHARTTEDGLRMLQHLRAARGGLIAFCSGPAGSFTRIVAPIFGSPFTYAAPADLPGMEGREPTAPGQFRVNDLLGRLPPGGLSPETAVLGVVGNPIGNSLSPWVQGMALKSAHLDAVYVAFEPQDFGRFLALATDENFRGLSVTAPFKEDAYAAVTVRDEPSERVKACNTLVRDGDGWRGYNTDLPAVKETLERAGELHGRVPGRPVAIGAARAAVGALREMNTPVTVAGRDPAKARALARQLGCESIPWDAIPTGDFDVLVNCTPVGSAGSSSAGELPLPEEWLGDDWLVLDAVYWPIRTPLLLAVKARGGTPVPGAEWFVRQAAAQFELFTRQSADESLMRAAFENAVQPGATPR